MRESEVSCGHRMEVRRYICAILNVKHVCHALYQRRIEKGM